MNKKFISNFLILTTIVTISFGAFNAANEISIKEINVAITNTIKINAEDDDDPYAG